MDARLLGGWHDVADDIRKLVTHLRALPDACTCGRGSAHLAGSCPCCRNRERTLDNGCTDCEALLKSLRDEIDELVDASLRSLPFVHAMVTRNASPSSQAVVRDVQRQIQHVAAVFHKVATAADEFRKDCSASHLAVLKDVAGDLGAATRHLDSMLEPVPPAVARTP